MNQFFLALLLVVSGLCWWLWQDNQALRQNKATKEVFDGIEEDSRDIDAADDSLIMQSPTN